MNVRVHFHHDADLTHSFNILVFEVEGSSVSDLYDALGDMGYKYPHWKLYLHKTMLSPHYARQLTDILELDDHLDVIQS